jgi:hypothetical protein
VCTFCNLANNNTRTGERFKQGISKLAGGLIKSEKKKKLKMPMLQGGSNMTGTICV